MKKTLEEIRDIVIIMVLITLMAGCIRLFKINKEANEYAHYMAYEYYEQDPCFNYLKETKSPKDIEEKEYEEYWRNAVKRFFD